MVADCIIRPPEKPQSKKGQNLSRRWRFPSLGSLGDGLFGCDVGHITAELDFIAGNLAFVDDAERHALINEILDERDFVALDRLLLNFTIGKLRLHTA